MADSNQIGKSIYSGTVAVGKINAVISVLFGLIIGTALIIYGYHESKDPHTQKVTGTITNDPTCTSNQNQNMTLYTCNVDITYTVDGKDYSISTQTTGDLYKKGSTISLFYNPSNPQDSVVGTMTPVQVEHVFIGIGITVFLFTIILGVLAWKSEGFTAILGASTLFNTFFRR